MDHDGLWLRVKSEMLDERKHDMKSVMVIFLLGLCSCAHLPLMSHSPKLKIHANERIVAIGDSITEGGGYLRDMDSVFAKQYPDLKIPPIINTGISGQKAEDLTSRFGRDVIQKRPAIVTINIGINDVWHRLGKPHDENVLKAYKANVAKMVDAAQAAGIRVVLCTPTIIQEDPKAEGNLRLAMYVDAMKQIAAEKKCMVADLHAAFIEAISQKPPDAKGNIITSDGVHMNAKGNWIMATCILNTLGIPSEKTATVQ